ncbi:hypothetical protein BDB00DRAFT_851023 [Zychaea mexicana]|uniref:uncharacterized protein n=1 Tax=Zychaea mexicana TaxID=64656 RepID=UPI0022FEB804|nr:uncharacterized protein BDB00DRAFT_851023 [Zychaea mexicana]KAI9487913.1 hypothetical protein BDB00DRAFT_851023 [Zychaea mexicana]
MMCDTNWCTFCDVAINPLSNSLYCSQECLKKDTIYHRSSRINFPQCRKSMVFRFSNSRRFEMVQQPQQPQTSLS